MDMFGVDEVSSRELVQYVAPSTKYRICHTPPQKTVIVIECLGDLLDLRKHNDNQGHQSGADAVVREAWIIRIRPIRRKATPEFKAKTILVKNRVLSTDVDGLYFEWEETTERARKCPVPYRTVVILRQSRFPTLLPLPQLATPVSVVTYQPTTFLIDKPPHLHTLRYNTDRFSWTVISLDALCTADCHCRT